MAQSNSAGESCAPARRATNNDAGYASLGSVQAAHAESSAYEDINISPKHAGSVRPEQQLTTAQPGCEQSENSGESFRQSASCALSATEVAALYSVPHKDKQSSTNRSIQSNIAISNGIKDGEANHGDSSDEGEEADVLPPRTLESYSTEDTKLSVEYEPSPFTSATEHLLSRSSSQVANPHDRANHNLSAAKNSDANTHYTTPLKSKPKQRSVVPASEYASILSDGEQSTNNPLHNGNQGIPEKQLELDGADDEWKEFDYC